MDNPLELNDLTPEQLRRLHAWMCDEDGWELFRRIAESEMTKCLSKSSREWQPGDNRDSLFLEREIFLAKWRTHKFYATLKTLVAGMIPSKPHNI